MCQSVKSAPSERAPATRSLLESVRPPPACPSVPLSATRPLGAALLAGVGCGLFDIDDLPSITLGDTAYPDPDTVDWYTQQRQTYRDLYRVLKPFNKRFEVGHPSARARESLSEAPKGLFTHASPDARHDTRRR